MNQEEGGRFFRNAWIAGVHKYYPGTPKLGYIAPWESMQEWEKAVVIALYQQVSALIRAGVQQGEVTHLNREQGGRVIRIGWIGQVYKHIPEPKSSYVCPWEEMTSWEKEVDMDIFQTIQKDISF